MKDRAIFKRELEEIKKEENLPRAICKLADVTYDIGLANCERAANLADEVSILKKILLGDGEPDASILNRLKSVENKVDTFTIEIKSIKGLLIGDFNQKELSLKDRIVKFEDYAQRSEKLQWFILTAIIGYVIAQILLAIF